MGWLDDFLFGKKDNPNNTLKALAFLQKQLPKQIRTPQAAQKTTLQGLAGIQRRIPQPVQERLSPQGLLKSIDLINQNVLGKDYKKRNVFSRIDYKNLPPQRKKEELDRISNFAIGFAGTAPIQTGSKIVNQIAKRLKITPADVIKGVRESKDPVFKSIAKQLISKKVISPSVKVAEYLDKAEDVTKSIKTFNLRIGTQGKGLQILKNVPKEEAARRVLEAQKKGIPFKLEEITQDMKNLDFVKGLRGSKNSKFLKDLKGKFKGSIKAIDNERGGINFRSKIGKEEAPGVVPKGTQELGATKSLSSSQSIPQAAKEGVSGLGKPQPQSVKTIEEVLSPIVKKTKVSATPNTPTLPASGDIPQIARGLSKGKGFPSGPSIPEPRNVNATDLVNYIKKNAPPNEKVNLLDYLRTPDLVLHKIGMGKSAELLKEKNLAYRLQLPKEIDKIRTWAKEVPEANEKIFKFLDGESSVALNPKELKVAKEIQKYLSDWADALKLPKDRRIASYITHLFEPELIAKEFDPDLAKLIQDKIPASVYDPFLQQRLGKLGYKQDTWGALDAYVKRATRKFHMDQALEVVQREAKQLDLQSYNYVKTYTSRINLRPSEFDSLLDNLIKSTPVGYKFGARPFTVLSRGIRNSVYRGTLGLNIGSALKNLTQGINTYAKLGEKYTVIGYTKTLKALLSRSNELEDVGVLANRLIEDRPLNAVAKGLQKLDPVLWTFFDFAEKINRGAAYYGAKSRALAKGLSEKEAIKAGYELARKTQFTFGSVDTPVALQSDSAKFLTQFQSYNIKQFEFIVEMIKNKEFASLIRLGAATTAAIGIVGDRLGLSWKDALILPNILSGQTKIGGTPFFQALGNTGTALLGEGYKQKQAQSKLKQSFIPFIPAGVQGKKTFGALGDIQGGGNRAAAGGLRYPVEPSIDSLLFGSGRTKQSRVYFDLQDTGLTPLSARQEGVYKELVELTGASEVQAWSLVQIARVTSTATSKIKQIQNNKSLSAEEKESQYDEVRGVYEERLTSLNKLLPPELLEDEEAFDAEINKLIDRLNSRK